LDPLIEMAKWHDSGHATPFRIILGRIGGIDEKRLQQMAGKSDQVDASSPQSAMRDELPRAHERSISETLLWLTETKRRLLHSPSPHRQYRSDGDRLLKPTTKATEFPEREVAENRARFQRTPGCW